MEVAQQLVVTYTATPQDIYSQTEKDKLKKEASSVFPKGTELLFPNYSTEFKFFLTDGAKSRKQIAYTKIASLGKSDRSDLSILDAKLFKNSVLLVFGVRKFGIYAAFLPTKSPTPIDLSLIDDKIFPVQNYPLSVGVSAAKIRVFNGEPTIVLQGGSAPLTFRFISRKWLLDTKDFRVLSYNTQSQGGADTFWTLVFENQLVKNVDNKIVGDAVKLTRSANNARTSVVWESLLDTTMSGIGNNFVGDFLISQNGELVYILLANKGKFWIQPIKWNNSTLTSAPSPITRPIYKPFGVNEIRRVQIQHHNNTESLVVSINQGNKLEQKWLYSIVTRKWTQLEIKKQSTKNNKLAGDKKVVKQ